MLSKTTNKMNNLTTNQQTNISASYKPPNKLDLTNQPTSQQVNQPVSQIRSKTTDRQTNKPTKQPTKSPPKLSISAPCLRLHRLLGLVVKVSASRAEDPGFDSHLRSGDFSGSSHTSDLQILTPVGYPARRLASKGQRWNWLSRCQYTATVLPTTSISVWQHVQLFEQIGP